MPRVALTLAAPDFLRLITGKLNGVNAFMSGKLKLKGDMMLAQTMQGWFDQSRRDTGLTCLEPPVLRRPSRGPGCISAG